MKPEFCLFRLPLGSATMLAALAAGEDLKDYAERAGISMNTVRFHLKTAYARTGIRRQSELVRLVTAALRDLADHRGKP
jgi:DNA-binding CsgD family transcriptional regulator